MYIIECKNLCMNYEGISVLNGISFSVCEGDFVAILGENGSGKSTLIKGILGLKQYNGSIIFNGLCRKNIGYLPQQTELQRDFPATVTEVVRSGCLNNTGFRPFYGKEEKKRACNAICTMRLENVKNRSYKNLSGGQQQRVLLARAFTATEKLLLLDEPTSGLDPISSSELYELTESLNKNRRVTILMVSHDIDSALKYANKVLHIGSDGGFFGNTDEYVRSPYFRGINKN